MINIKEYIRKKTWVFLKAKWRLRSGLNVIIENDSDWFVYNEIFVNKEYDQALNVFLSGLTNEHPVIVDLGANVGYFSIRIADELICAGKDRFSIIALEAAPQNFTVLDGRVQQKGLSGNISAKLGLAGYKTGTETVVHSAQHYGHSSAGVGHAEGKKSVVSYIDIESLIPREKDIDFLKCDIEGSEEIFINEYAGLLKRVKLAVFEFHAGECNVANCRAMLEKAGLISAGILKEDPAFKTSVEIFKRN